MALNLKQWGAIFIAGLFAMSIVGFIGVGNSNPVTGAATSTSLYYNSYTFTKNGNYWQTSVNNIDFLFTSPPSALEVFEIPEDSSEIINFNKIYLAYNPEQSLDLSIIRFHAVSFFSNFNIRSFEACIEEEGCPNIPIVDCTEDHAIIFIQDNDITEVTTKDNCIEVHSANIETMQRQLERIFYQSLGIMQ